jgi:hypothetical protein
VIRFISILVQLCTLDSYYFDGRRIVARED